jgi:hypothetical protein
VAAGRHARARQRPRRHRKSAAILGAGWAVWGWVASGATASFLAVNVAHQVVVHTTVHTDDLAATILGALGVLLALGSLGWQAFTFFRSGSRVKVVLRMGASSGQAVVTTADAPTASQLSSMQAQGFVMPVFGVDVLNAGRGPTSVVSVDVVFGHGGALGGAYVAGSPDLPFRIDGESEQTWYLDAANVRAAAEAFEAVMKNGKPQFVRGRVRLGGKKKPVISKNRIRVR